MSDNTLQTGSDTIRTKDRSGVKTPATIIDLNPGGAETLMNGSMPVTSTDLGTTADASASTDSGTFSLISLVKRLLGKVPALGSAVSASSLPVVVASDQAAVAVKLSQVAGTNVTVGSGVLGAGTQRVVLATDQPVIPVSDNAGSLTVDSPDIGLVADAAVTTNATGSLSAKLRGVVALLAAALPTSIGQKAMAASMGVVLASDQSAIPVNLVPGAGGWSPSFQSALTNTKVLVKGSAGALGGYLSVWNPNTSVVYIQVFDAALAATPTLGTTVPNAVIAVPPQAAGPGEVTVGIPVAAGIVIAATTTPTGLTAPSSALVATLLYK
jgi:hypothetical protein